MEVEDEGVSLDSEGDYEMAVDKGPDEAGPSISADLPNRPRWSPPADSTDVESSQGDENEEMDAADDISAEEINRPLVAGTDLREHRTPRVDDDVVDETPVRRHGEDCDDVSLVPVSAVVDGCIVQGILSQHRHELPVR